MKELKCFVVMPYSGIGTNERDQTYWTNFYNFFLQNVFEDSFNVKNCQDKYKINISKHEVLSGDMLSQIVPKLAESDLTLVILTDLKSNVIYELGIRHALRHGTILACIKSNLDNYKNNFSDLHGVFFIPYEDYNIDSFRTEIEKILKEFGLPMLWNDSKVKNYLDVIKRKEFSETITYSILEKKCGFVNNLNLEILWMDNYSETVAPIIGFLLAKGCRVNFAVSTSHFLLYAEENTYDVIISDMREGKDENEGIELFKIIRKEQNKNRLTPFIIFAGPNSMSKYKDDAKNEGIEENNLIEEPVSLVYRLKEISNEKLVSAK